MPCITAVRWERRGCVMEGDEGDGEENVRKADGAGLGCPTWPRVATIGSETTRM